MSTDVKLVSKVEILTYSDGSVKINHIPIIEDITKTNNSIQIKMKKETLHQATLILPRREVQYNNSYILYLLEDFNGKMIGIMYNGEEYKVKFTNYKGGQCRFTYTSKICRKLIDDGVMEGDILELKFSDDKLYMKVIKK